MTMTGALDEKQPADNEPADLVKLHADNRLVAHENEKDRHPGVKDQFYQKVLIM
jgi:hypothetical protein